MPDYISRILDYLDALEVVSGTNDQITRLKAVVKALDRVDIAALQQRRIRIALNTDGFGSVIEYAVAEEIEQFDNRDWHTGYKTNFLGSGDCTNVADVLIEIGNILEVGND